jgi:hypothetical protein
MIEHEVRTHPSAARLAREYQLASELAAVATLLRLAMLALRATGREIAHALRDVWGFYQPQETL